VTSGRARVIIRLAGALGVLAVIAGTLGGAGRAQAATRLTRAPYVQDARPTAMSVLWRTDVPALHSVEVRAAGAASAPWQAFTGGERTTNAAVTLTGLDPGALYEYRVRADGEVISDVARFRTLPPASADRLDFVVYGDNRTNHSPHSEVVRRILAEATPPQLLIHTGDLVETGGQSDLWEVFFQIERELLARVPLFPAIGNHEDDSPVYFESFRVPGNGTPQGSGRWYGFDAGPAHFVALDVVFSDIEPGTAQYRWLENDLARSDRPFKFVYFHYPPYNASTPHLSSVRLRTALENLFLQHKVSAVFTGHAHVYERAEGAGNPPLTYFVSGGGGAPQHTVGQQGFTRYSETSYHFLRVSLRGDRMMTTGVRIDGSEFDPLEARLDANGRLAVTRAASGQPVVMARPSVLDLLRSRGGQVLAGYGVLFGGVLPVGLALALRPRRRIVIPVPSGPHAPAPVDFTDAYAGWRGLPVMRLAGGLAVLVLVALLPSTPLHLLFGFDRYSIVLTLHAAVGLGLLLSTAVAATMGYRLAARRGPAVRALGSAVFVAAACALTVALLGNVLYSEYLRSDGPKELLIRKAPEAHTILFEFKEFAGLVPLPLAVAATYVVWRYWEYLRRDRYVMELVSLVLVVLAGYCVLPLGLGTAITRLRGILP